MPVIIDTTYTSNSGIGSFITTVDGRSAKE
jgi:hypothetical protein